jgi:hypothetical protein
MIKSQMEVTKNIGLQKIRATLISIKNEEIKLEGAGCLSILPPPVFRVS